MALILQGVILTQSRGGFLALVATVGISLLIHFRGRRGMLPLGLALAGLVALAPARAGELDAEDKSDYYRLEMWSAGIQMFKENPVLGVGKGRFSDFSRIMTGTRLIAHNSYIENMAETGFVGLFVYASLVYMTLKGLRLTLRKITDPLEQSLAKALLVSVLGYAAASMFITTDFDLFYVQLGSDSRVLLGARSVC